MSHLVRAADLAKEYRVAPETIYAWARRGLIPHVRAGRILRFDPDEVRETFRRRETQQNETDAQSRRPGE